MAPEVIALKPPTSKSDIWSVGCLCLELLTGKPPYYNLTPMSALFHICSDSVVPIEDPSHNITQECMEFILECFQRDPTRRKSAAELLNHSWFKQHGIRSERMIPVPLNTAAKPQPTRSGHTFSLPSRVAPVGVRRGTRLPSRQCCRESMTCRSPSPFHSRSSSASSSSLMKEMEELDIDKMIDEAGIGLSNPSLPQPSAPPTTRPANTRVSAPPLQKRSSVCNDERVNDEFQVESEIIMNIQIISEASLDENKQSEPVVLGALKAILEAISSHSFTRAFLINNNGLYPLVSTCIKYKTNYSICVYCLQVVPHVRADA